jgi:hypothetical protein
MRRTSALALLLALAGTLVYGAAAAGPRDALSLVPLDATSVGFVRVADLRTNPFQLRIFEETDKLSADGEAARFLEEAGLNLRQDVDDIVVCAVSDSTPRGILLLAEGRFDPKKLSAAVAKRGAEPRVAPGGNYFRLSGSSNGSREDRHPGAVAFVDARTVLAGSEPAVVSALWARASGGTGFASGQGLGRELRRVDPSSTAWALVDVAKWRPARPIRSDSPAAGVVSTLKSVTLVTFQATVQGDALSLKATGLSPDEETRGLLEDALRGLTAAWRLSAQEKSPELVAAIRKIQVSRDGEGVTISGTVPGELLRSLALAHKQGGK